VEDEQIGGIKKKNTPSGTGQHDTGIFSSSQWKKWKNLFKEHLLCNVKNGSDGAYKIKTFLYAQILYTIDITIMKYLQWNSKKFSHRAV
jgi:hypothetical protein